MDKLLEYLVPALAFASVIMTGWAMISTYSAERRAVRKRLDAIDGPSTSRAEERPKGFMTRALSRLGLLSARSKPSATLMQQLANAGYYGSLAPAIYLGAKQILLLVGLVGATILLSAADVAVRTRVLVSISAGLVLFFVPNVIVQMRRRKRTRHVHHHLPDAIDLLEICVASGMGLDMAWNSVAEEIRKVSGTLGDEMALTNLEIHLGAQRGDAMRHMADRTGVEELGSLVSLLVQSDRFGTSISDTLKAFAHSMREERSLKAQEAAEKMAVKLLIPMVLCIFPAVLIVLVGPAAIRLYTAMRLH